MASVIHSDSNLKFHHDTRPLIDRIAADYGNAIWLAGRFLMAALFLQSGFEKLMALEDFAALLAGYGIPLPSLVAPIAAAVEFGGGLALAIGFGTRYAALVMVAFMIVATLISHRFWTEPEAEREAQMIHFAKNVAIMGGFLFVFVTGGGRFSFDRWLRHSS